MTQPEITDVLWENYKEFFSLMLLAICDARYYFSFIDSFIDGS